MATDSKLGKISRIRAFCKLTPKNTANITKTKAMKFNLKKKGEGGVYIKLLGPGHCPAVYDIHCDMYVTKA